MAASFSTLVVSWKDAAEMKLLVCSAALVIPWRTCDGSGRDCIPGLNQFHILPLQHRIIIPELPGSDNLTGLIILGIARFNHYLLAVDPVILVHEIPLVNHLLLQEFGIARILNFHLAHHLAHNDLEVLVIDLHTLHTVNFLNLIHNVLLNLGGSFNGQDISRGDGTIRQRCTGLYVIILLYQDLLGQWYQVFLYFTGLGSDDDLTVTTLDLAKGYFTVDFRNHSRIGRIPGFKQFGYPWQTTGDIT